MTSTVYEYEKYVSTLDNVSQTLAKYGVAILPRVLNDTECAEMHVGMWNALETITGPWPVPIDRGNPESWRGISGLFPSHSMLLQHHGIGHAQFIWDLRQNPKCMDVFARLWKCAPDELLVSFDGAAFHMPPENTKIGWHRQTWFHTDQSYTRREFECVQSWVTALDVNENDATLAVYEGSHAYHAEFAEKFGVTKKDNWYKLDTEEQKEFYRSRCEERYIKCPRGSIVLWDSRTIHCGVEPRKTRSAPNTRCVAYLCYMPRSLASDKELAKKVAAYENGRMTSHWPCKVKLFPKQPQTYGRPVSETCGLPAPILTDMGRRLAGYK